jgi:hypothetical protein
MTNQNQQNQNQDQQDQHQKNQKPQKQVKFDRATYFLVTPMKENCETDLWWTDYDYFKSRITSQMEINRLLGIDKSMAVKDAVKLLYQPGNISFNEDNFH